MPSWVGVLATVVGSGGLAGLLVGMIAPYINHRLQVRRDRDRESREARATYVTRQRELCTQLLDVAIRASHAILTIRPIHDNLASRWTARKPLEMESQQLPSYIEEVRSIRRELDLEPNAQLQGAIERWGDAFIAYNQALCGPLSSWWNPVKFYLGRTSPEELKRLAGDFDMKSQELKTVVREYMASLVSQAPAQPIRSLRNRVPQ